MKILLVSASADWSIIDVANGYAEAFKRMGHDVRTFPLNHWIKFMGGRMMDWRGDSSVDVTSQLATLQLAAEKSVVDAIRHQADLVVIASGMAYHPDAMKMIHNDLGYKTALICTESPYNDGDQQYLAQFADLVTVNDRVGLDHLDHPNVHYLPQAYDPEVHRPMEIGPEYASDVFFVGTGFAVRQEMLESVDWLDIDLRLYGYWNANESSPIAKYLTDGVLDNKEAAKWYNGTKVGLNFHRTAFGYSANPRVFELAACGTHQLVDGSRPEVQEIFGASVCYFTDAFDFESKLMSCLADSTHRRRSAKEALKRVQGHTFDNRAKELLSWL